MSDKITGKKIRELHLSGKTNQEIQDELGVTNKKVWNAIDYLMKKTKVVQKVEFNQGELYLDRDNLLMMFYASLNTKGAMSMYHIDECKAKYGRKAA